MKDSHSPSDRKDMAESLRSIRRECDDKDYARAFCTAVLANFRTGLAVRPVRAADGRWFPRRRKTHGQ